MKNLFLTILIFCSIIANAQRGVPEPVIVQSDTGAAVYKVATKTWVKANAGTTPIDDVLDWQTNKYTLYAAAASGKLFNGLSASNNTANMGWDGNFGAYSLTAGAGGISSGTYNAGANQLNLSGQALNFVSGTFQYFGYYRLSQIQLTNIIGGGDGMNFQPSCAVGSIPFFLNSWNTINPGIQLFELKNNAVDKFVVYGNGNTTSGKLSVNTYNQPTAQLEIAAGTAAAGTANMKLFKSVLLTNTEIGAVERDNKNLYVTDDTSKRQILIPSAYGEVYLNPDSTYTKSLSVGANSFYLGHKTKFEVTTASRYLKANTLDTMAIYGGIGSSIEALSGGDGICVFQYHISLKTNTLSGISIKCQFMRGGNYLIQSKSFLDIPVSLSGFNLQMSGIATVPMAVNNQVFLLMEISSGDVNTLTITQCSITGYRISR